MSSILDCVDDTNSSVIAVVEGKKLTEIPSDLYIPPDALDVLLESFSGPLDLLLYLIRRQHIDIMAIPIVDITEQYMLYIEWMESARMELAIDYLVMAATLAYIKSRMLLPVLSSEEDEEDPRMVLVRQLQQYEACKRAAEDLDGLIRCERDVFAVSIQIPFFSPLLPQVKLSELVLLKPNDQGKTELSNHVVDQNELCLDKRIEDIKALIEIKRCVEFAELYHQDEGRDGLIISFLALLELARLALIVVLQAEAFGSLYLKAIEHD